MKEKEKRIQPNMDRRDKRAKTIYKKVKLFMSISAIILGIFFTWLQIDLTILKPLFINETANLLFKLSIVLYYFSWIFGANADLRDEEYTLRVYPNNNKITKIGFSTLVLLVIIFASLCYLNTEKLFIIALNVFLVANIISWRYLVNFVKDAFEKNKSEVTNMFDIEYQKILENYLMGNWQCNRFLYALIYVTLLNVVIFSELHVVLSSKLDISSQLIISIGFLLYILSFELWIWVMRIQRIITFHAYDKLDDLYELNLISDTNED